MGKVVEFLRWAGFLPIGFLASLVAGVAGYYLVWRGVLVHMARQRWCLRCGLYRRGVSIAPRVSTPVKWIVLGIVMVMVLGVLSALGPVLVGREMSRSFASIAMFVAAVHFARLPQRKSA